MKKWCQVLRRGCRQFPWPPRSAKCRCQTETSDRFRFPRLVANGYASGNRSLHFLVVGTADVFLQARELLREWGPVHPGSSAADFNIVRAAEVPGWLVTCHHPDIITFVADYARDGSSLSPRNAETYEFPSARAGIPPAFPVAHPQPTLQPLVEFIEQGGNWRLPRQTSFCPNAARAGSSGQAAGTCPFGVVGCLQTEIHVVEEEFPVRGAGVALELKNAASVLDPVA